MIRAVKKRSATAQRQERLKAILHMVHEYANFVSSAEMVMSGEISTANDIAFTPMLALIFPGFAIELAVSKFTGRNVLESFQAWRTTQFMDWFCTVGIRLRIEFRGVA